MAQAIRAKFPPAFGAFTPKGHIVMAFDNDDNAAIARGALLAEGFGEDDVTRYPAQEVIAAYKRSNEEAANPAQLGQDVDKINDYLVLAKSGCGFLVVHAPEDERTKRAIAIVLPYGLKFAEKYNQLTLEELA
jgi:hypothetical protein